LGSAFVLFAQDNGGGNRGYLTTSQLSLQKSQQKTQGEAPEKTKEKTTSSRTSKALDAAEKEEKDLTEFQKWARRYRKEGLDLQRAGNTQEALALYQKAIELDPFYATVYNDLGVLYEGRGDVERAQENYLKAIQVDPNCLSAYSNLALLYESQRDLKTAAQWWQKRLDMGSAEDPWTQKAKRRLRDIRMVLGENADALEEEDVLGLTEETSRKKELLRGDDQAQAEDLFQQAQQHYKKGQDELAYRETVAALQLDPDNKEISEYAEKIQRRLLTK
jgi:tetratricopeptide (TPR) repeat protein